MLRVALKSRCVAPMARPPVVWSTLEDTVEGSTWATIVITRAGRVGAVETERGCSPVRVGAADVHAVASNVTAIIKPATFRMVVPPRARSSLNGVKEKSQPL